MKDEIDKLTDPKDENASRNCLSSDNDDSLDNKTLDITDTAETDHYSITEDHVESGSQDSEDSEY